MVQPPGLEQNRATLRKLVRRGERQAFAKFFAALAARAEGHSRQLGEIPVARAVHKNPRLRLLFALGPQPAKRNPLNPLVFHRRGGHLRIEQERKPLLLKQRVPEARRPR